MRNLKKVLSLVLAVAMMVSICVVGAGAVNYDDFTDKNEITKTQAVETLVSLNVILGYNGGETFAPKANVTRAEMATMICRVLAGGDNMIVDATKAVPTYTDIDGHWAESYIEYCTSLGIVSGKGANMFDPNANVTAAEAAKMVMTALGYNADIEGFKGTGWDINTMAKANTLGLLDNLQNEVSANVALTREQVAQLLFNALDTALVQNYNGNVANTWVSSGADAYQLTLLETKFNAEKVVGVVVANEYADLYDTEALASGKTRVMVLGTDNEPTKQEYTLNLTTTLDQIGESIIVYRDKSSNRVIFGNDQDSGLNVVNEYTAKGDITNSKDFENAVSKNDLKTAEYFVNFDIGSEVTSAYKLKYVIEMYMTETEAANLVKDNKGSVDKGAAGTGDNAGDYLYTYTKSITKNTALTSADLFYIETIFDIADATKTDYVKGEVYVGTQSNTDISDEISYEKFWDEYLEVSLDNEKVTENENGNYIKTVDYNNDGAIDYVLKTEYVMTTITDISKKGEYTFESVKGAIDEDDIDTADELAEDDVILYSYIDGVYYVQVPEMVTVSIAKKGIDYKNDTVTTTDGDVYEQSGIDYTAADYENDITDADTEVAYDMYLDLFGYVRLYTESAYNRGMVLLLDGYYETDLRDDLYKAEIFDAEAEERADVTVLDTKDNAANVFISDKIDAGNNKAEEGTWKRLNPVDSVYFTSNEDYLTNIAAYTVNDNDEYTLEKVDNKDAVSNKKAYDVVELTIDSKTELKDRTLVSNAATGDKVQTTNDTVYYLVTTKGTKVDSVITWTGYNNAPASAGLADDAVAYAVTTAGDGAYDVAEIVVFESETASASSLYFVYGLNAKTWDDADSVFSIGYDSENEAYESNMQVDIKQNYPDGVYTNLDFYTIYDNGTVKAVDYTDSYIYAGTARVSSDVNSRDYEVVDTDNQGTFEFIPANTPCYVVTMNDKSSATVRDIYDVKEQEDAFEAGDRVIVVADKKDNVQYVINVTQSVYGKNDTQIARILELWGEIKADNDFKDTTVADTLKAAQDALTALTTATAGSDAAALKTAIDNATNVKTALDKLDVTGSDKTLRDMLSADLADALTAGQTKLEQLTDADDLATAKADAKAALDSFVAQMDGDNFLADSNSKTAKLVAWIKGVIDFQSTAADATSIFSYDENATGEKWSGKMYDKGGDFGTQMNTASGVTATGNLKQDVMDAISSDNTDLTGAKSTAKGAVDSALNEYTKSQFTMEQWNELEKIAQDTKDAIDATTIKADAEAGDDTIVSDLAEKVLDWAVAKLNTITVTATSNFTENDIASAVNTLLGTTSGANAGIKTVQNSGNASISDIVTYADSATATLKLECAATSASAVTRSIEITVTVAP